jgi:UDP-glucose 4-epimerase
MRRVVVTGIGIVSSIGNNKAEVIDSLKRVSGVDFPVREAARRAGDPPELIAGTREIQHALNWTPKYDDLDFIVENALKWEQHLRKKAAA